MKKIFKKICIAVFIIMLFVIIIFGAKKISDKVHKKNITDYTWLTKNVSIEYNLEFGDRIYDVSKNNDINIYNSNYRKVIKEKYETLKNNSNYTINNPLLIYNLYGTNLLGFNIYFITSEDSYLDYSIIIDKENVNNFARTLKNDGENNLTKEHEYQLVGFVKGYVNKLKLELKNSKGEILDTQEIKIDLTNLETNSQTFAEVKNGESEESLENGLYTILGNDSDEQDYVAMYDNYGILRSEIPIIGYRAHQILFKDNSMYFSISQSKIAKISRLGEVEKVYSMGHYYLHHDYTFSADGNLLVLANNLEKDTEEDCIVKINLETKEVTELIDFEDIFESYVKTCYWDKAGQRDEGEDGLDWLHLNSIEYVDGDVYLSSRETSSILKLKNIETNPELEYIISDEDIWKDTEFSDYVYKKVGDFKIHAGQHSVRYISSDEENIYYLAFFNNNYGKSSSQPDYDYTKIGITNQNSFVGDYSYYYVYKVNETEKTFELVDNIELVYSGIVSSIQNLENGNILTDSGTAGIYAEYDNNHKLIKQFSLNLNKYMLYRVLKFDYKELWFN